MAKNDLTKRLEALGFQLFATQEPEDVNLVLAEVVRSGDLRLWEGFPTVLANSALRGFFDLRKVTILLNNASDMHNFKYLLAVSLALYKFFNVKLSWAEELYNSMTSNDKKLCDSYLKSLRHEDTLKLGKYKMSVERLKTAFNNYFVRSGKEMSELLETKKELGLEYALSQVFSAGQKDLFLKKLKGEKLTKTESEYFSRVVKKKVLALANSELHRLAQKLLK